MGRYFVLYEVSIARDLAERYMVCQRTKKGMRYGVQLSPLSPPAIVDQVYCFDDLSLAVSCQLSLNQNIRKTNPTLVDKCLDWFFSLIAR